MEATVVKDWTWRLVVDGGDGASDGTDHHCRWFDIEERGE